MHTLGSKNWSPISKSRERRFAGKSIFEIAGHNYKKNGVVETSVHSAHFNQPSANKVVPIASADSKAAPSARSESHAHTDAVHSMFPVPSTNGTHAPQPPALKLNAHHHDEESASHSSPHNRNNCTPSSKSTHRRHSHDHGDLGAENTNLDLHCSHKKQQPATPSNKRKGRDHIQEEEK